MDRVEATPARELATLPWEAAASERLAQLVSAEPVLVQISAAKRLRDRAEQLARAAGEQQVNAARVDAAAQVARV
jgi:chlorophyllide a reductase subunit Z